jgi:heme/copper-type cytochrome/quinol oxidase subunit 2
MTYQDELQQYEDKVARQRRLINWLLVSCFVMIILIIAMVITGVGWMARKKHPEPAHKIGYTKIEYGLGVNAKGDTIKIFEYSNQ